MSDKDLKQSLRINISEFDGWQKKELELGLDHGLKPAQIRRYADPKLSNAQMAEIRMGIENGLPQKQIDLYATPGISPMQMQGIRIALEIAKRKSIPLDYIKMLINPQFDFYQMEQIRLGFEHGLKPWQVSHYADWQYSYTCMKMIRLGYEERMSPEKINCYAKPWYGERQMEEIRNGLTTLSVEQVKAYAKHEFSPEQMSEIRRAYQTLSDDKVYFIAEYKYRGQHLSAGQMAEIRQGMEKGLTPEQIQFLLTNINDGSYNSPFYSPEQMKQIRLGFEHGLTTEQVSIFADYRFSGEEMARLRILFEGGASSHSVELAINPYKDIDKMLEEKLGKAFAELSGAQIKQIHLGFDHGLGEETMLQYANPLLSAQIMQIIREAIEMRTVPEEHLDFLINPSFDIYQIGKICEGFKLGLPLDDIRLFARPEFDFCQMQQIINGIESLSREDIKIYANPDFSAGKMAQIRFGLEYGLGSERVLIFANPMFSIAQMECIRLALQSGVPEDLVRIAANPHYSEGKIDTMLAGLKSGIPKSEMVLLAELDTAELKEFCKCYHDKTFNRKFRLSLEKEHPNLCEKVRTQYSLDLDKKQKAAEH